MLGGIDAVVRVSELRGGAGVRVAVHRKDGGKLMFAIHSFVDRDNVGFFYNEIKEDLRNVIQQSESGSGACGKQGCVRPGVERGAVGGRRKHSGVQRKSVDGGGTDGEAYSAPRGRRRGGAGKRGG